MFIENLHQADFKAPGTNLDHGGGGWRKCGGCFNMQQLKYSISASYATPKGAFCSEGKEGQLCHYVMSTLPAWTS